VEFIKFSEKNETPKWLSRIVPIDEFNGMNRTRLYLRHIAMDMRHVNIEDVLKESCFYYCSGSDITPIVAFEEYIHSYIYCDNCEFQNFDIALSSLKKKLRDKKFNEIQKINVDSNFFNLSGLKNKSIPAHLRLLSPIPKGEFSIWKKGRHLYSLIYLCWDDICALYDLYIKNEIYPIAICNSNPESGNIYPENITLKENNFPKYIIGHCNKISETFIEFGKVEYYGNYSDNSTLYKNPNKINE
jgi:hypothetical protein